MRQQESATTLTLTAEPTDLLRPLSAPSTKDPKLTVCHYHYLLHYLSIVCSVIYYTGSYPLAINRDVSPLGNHTLTIFVRDDEGFEADVTVPYFLEEDSKPTGGSFTFTEYLFHSSA